MFLRFIYKNEKYNETEQNKSEFNKFDKKRINNNIEISLNKFQLFINGMFETLKFLKQIRKIFFFICIFWCILLLLSLLFKKKESDFFENSLDFPLGRFIFLR